MLKFRLPTFRDLIALFRSPTKVEHAVHGIEAAVTAAERVQEHNERKARARRERAFDMEALAFDNHQAAREHREEADRAQRVTGRLRELVA